MTAHPARQSRVPGIVLGLGLGGFADGIALHVEGLVDHHVLGIHHVRDLPAHVPAYDWIFLGVGGVGLIAAGWLLASRAPATRPAGAPAAR